MHWPGAAWPQRGLGAARDFHHGLLTSATVILAWVALASWPTIVDAQPLALTAEQVALGDAVRARFEVVTLVDGLGLSPRDTSVPARMIQFGDGIVAVDGAPVSGRRLRDLLGEDADLVLRLTYLDAPARDALFGGGADGAPEPPPEIPSEPAAAAAARDEVDAVPPAPEPRRARRSTRSHVFRIGGPVTVEQDERVRGNVVVIGGPLTIDGEVAGDVVLVGGTARFGPEAFVRGEVTIVGGSLVRAPTSEFRRGINHVDLGRFEFLDGRDNWFADGWPFRRFDAQAFRVWDLAGTVLRLIFLALMASIIVFVGRGSVERTARRSRAEPLKAGAVGFLAQVLLLPLTVAGIVLLVISIIGIPLLVLLPFVGIAILLVMVVGFTGVVHGLGDWFGGRMGRTTPAPYLSVWVGIALLLIPTMAGEAMDFAGDAFRMFAVLFVLTGLFVEYAAWTTGLGAVILNRFGAPISPPVGSGGQPLTRPPPPDLDRPIRDGAPGASGDPASDTPFDPI